MLDFLDYVSRVLGQELGLAGGIGVLDGIWLAGFYILLILWLYPRE